MLRTRTQFADSVRRFVCLGCRFSQVVLLASFAATVGIAGHAFAAEPVPPAPTPTAPPASKDESGQQTIEKRNKWLREMDEQRAVIRKERDNYMGKRTPCEMKSSRRAV